MAADGIGSPSNYLMKKENLVRDDDIVLKNGYLHTNIH